MPGVRGCSYSAAWLDGLVVVEEIIDDVSICTALVEAAIRAGDTAMALAFCRALKDPDRRAEVALRLVAA